MKNKYFIIIGLFIFGAGIYLFSSNQNTYKQDQNKKEGISCGSTLERRCYKYRCETGYLPSIPPPGGPGLCSDGSTPTQLEEVVMSR